MTDAGHGVEDFLVDMGVDFGVEQTGLEGPGAAEAPGGGDHFFDDVHFDIVGGLEAVDVLVEVGLKISGSSCWRTTVAARRP